MKTVLQSSLHLLVALILGSGSPVVAQSHTDGRAVGASEETRLTSAAREAVVASLARHLRSDYVFPDIGKTVADALTAKLAKGGYDSMSSAATFAEALTQDMREIGKDAHFGVRFAPDQNDNKPEDAEQERRIVARQGFGISAVQRLPGNIGYLDVRGFAPTPLVADAYASAMLLLSGTDALIVDLRRNGGGEPQSVTELASYLFSANDIRHLNDLYSRADDQTVEFRTNPKVSVHYMGPVHILTSRFTFSGGEEFAYDIQTQKRGTLVGEVTGGGANPGDFVSLSNGFVAFIPNGRAINPVTKTNWEHVGVRPDVPASASEAMKVAYIASLKLLIAKSNDPKQHQSLSRLVASAENGEVQLPGYAPPTR